MRRYNIRKFGGEKEDPTRCVVMVSDSTGWSFPQCSRKRGHGEHRDLCWQHGGTSDNFGRARLHIPFDQEESEG